MVRVFSMQFNLASPRETGLKRDITLIFILSSLHQYILTSLIVYLQPFFIHCILKESLVWAFKINAMSE